MKLLRDLSLLLLLLFVFVGCSNYSNRKSGRRTSPYVAGAKVLSRAVVVRELNLLEERTTRYNNRIDKEYVMKSDANLSANVKHMQKGARKMEKIQMLLKKKLKKPGKKIQITRSEWYHCYDVGVRDRR